jgi:hypothetical protein
MLADEDWEGLRRQLWEGEAELATVSARLIDLGEALHGLLVAASSLRREWAPLGVDVHEVPMIGRGSCSVRGVSRTIYVNARDSPRLRRFTVAHEVAHLLLEGQLAGKLGMRGVRAEERLCDRFASSVLIPRSELAEALGAIGIPLGPDDLLRLCGRFRVNVRPILFAVGECLADTPHFLLAARYQGHRMRPDEEAFRVVATAGARHAYFPPEQRLASLGFSNLVAWAERASHGDLFVGADSGVMLGLRGLSGTRSSTTVQGAAAWRAARVGDESPYVLAVIDLGAMAGFPIR